MNSLDGPDPFHGVLHWHRFDQRMTDEELADALESIGVMAIMIDRKQQVVFVDKDNSFTPQIQKLLNNWSPQ
jgi:protein-L-isoaspartate O-methyltransferase